MKIAPLLLLSFLPACVTLGPFVTDVTPLDDGRIRVRKCEVTGNLLPVAGALYDDACTYEIVEVKTPPAPAP